MSARVLWRKLLQGLGVLWGAWTLVFFIFAFVPDPARQMAGQNERQEVVDAFRARHGLDRPLLERYGRFWTELSPVKWSDEDGVHWAPPNIPTPVAMNTLRSISASALREKSGRSQRSL